MYRLAIEKGAARRPAAGDRKFREIDIDRAVMRPKAKMFAVLQQHSGIVGLAEIARPLDNGVQHWLNVRRRGGDDVQDAGAAGLVREGFLEVARLGLHLAEQAN